MNLYKLYEKYEGKQIQIGEIQGTVVGYNEEENVIILGVEDGDYPCWPSSFLAPSDEINIRGDYYLYVLPEDILN